MPHRDVAIDAGPLLGLLNPRDAWHDVSVEAWQGLADFCVTTEAVLAEAFADASLVAVAEALGITRVFTIDRRGFSAYRMAGGRRFEVLP